MWPPWDAHPDSATPCICLNQLAYLHVGSEIITRVLDLQSKDVLGIICSVISSVIFLKPPEFFVLKMKCKVRLTCTNCCYERCTPSKLY